MSKDWTKEQHEERERMMQKSTLPLCGSRPGQGYVGSREMVADLVADKLYEHRKAFEPLTKELLEELLAKPPGPYDDLHQYINFITDSRKLYPHLDYSGATEWITKALEILNEIKYP